MCLQLRRLNTTRISLCAQKAKARGREMPVYKRDIKKKKEKKRENNISEGNIEIITSAPTWPVTGGSFSIFHSFYTVELYNYLNFLTWTKTYTKIAREVLKRNKR